MRRHRLERDAHLARVDFAFTHALVRETVHDECNVLRRARLHRRAAEALTGLGEDHHLEEIALHLFETAQVADARRAAELLARAGRRALDRLAYEDAAERFERALEALELAGADDDSGPVLLARGDALLRAGEREAARAAFSAARALALRRGDDAVLAEVRVDLAPGEEGPVVVGGGHRDAVAQLVVLDAGVEVGAGEGEDVEQLRAGVDVLLPCAAGLEAPSTV